MPAPCLRRSRTATPPAPAHPGARQARLPPMRAYFLRRLEFFQTPKPEHTLRLQTNLQQPKLFVRHRKLAKHPGGHVVVCSLAVL